jgi:hypothetical protein
LPWILAPLLALGCRSTPRVIDPDDRELEPPPFALHFQGKGADSADDEPGKKDGLKSYYRDDAPDESGPDGDGAGDGDGDDDSEPESWPNVQDPGPDMANFPNSAFTIPRGAAHIEFSPVTLSGPTDNNGPNYSTQFLLRYGLTDRLEVRMFGIGFFALFNSPQKTTGFAPIAFDMKTNLWRESRNHLIPAAGLEVYLQTEFGSPALRSGLQPGLSLLFDHTLPLNINFEWNIGVNGAEKPIGRLHDSPNGPLNFVHTPEENTLELNLQWALQRRFFKKLDVFTHGFLNGSAIPNVADGITVGGGAIWLMNPRLSLFGSYNAGLTKDAATTFFLLGFAYAL